MHTEKNLFEQLCYLNVLAIKPAERKVTNKSILKPEGQCFVFAVTKEDAHGFSGPYALQSSSGAKETSVLSWELP